MFKDIITYNLAENVSEEHLFKVADQVLKSWMSKQAGFIKWEIHKNHDGGYTDIVYWESEEAAKKAEADMVNIPNPNDWYACYQPDSFSRKKISHLKTFP